MKKKLFLIVTIIIIAVLVCMSLVSCDGLLGGNNERNTDNNQEEIIEGGGDNQGEDNNDGTGESVIYDTPVDYFTAWISADKKSMIGYGGSNEFAIYEDLVIYYQRGNEYIIINIIEKNKDGIHFNFYNGKQVADEETFDWSESAILTQDELNEIGFVYDISKSMLDNFNATALELSNGVMETEWTKEDECFTYNDNYSGKTAAKINGNVLDFWWFFNDFIDGDTSACQYVIGYSEIIIPKEAKDALEAYRQSQEQPE